MLTDDDEEEEDEDEEEAAPLVRLRVDRLLADTSLFRFDVAGLDEGCGEKVASNMERSGGGMSASGCEFCAAACEPADCCFIRCEIKYMVCRCSCHKSWYCRLSCSTSEARLAMVNCPPRLGSCVLLLLPVLP